MNVLFEEAHNAMSFTCRKDIADKVGEMWSSLLLN